MWRCASCGETQEDQFDACWSCGAAKGTQPAVAGSIAPAERITVPKFCSFCGKPLPPGGRFCGECGAAVTSGGRVGQSTAGSWPAPRENAPGAVSSLVTGLIGMFFLSLPLGCVAVTQSNSARRRIRDNPALGGNGMAQAGLVLGILDIVGGALWVLFVLATGLSPFLLLL